MHDLQVARRKEFLGNDSGDPLETDAQSDSQTIDVTATLEATGYINRALTSR